MAVCGQKALDRREGSKHIFAAIAEGVATDKQGLPIVSADYLGCAVFEMPISDNLHLAHGDIVVAAAHRRERLRLWVKAANVEYLGREYPQVKRIHTWNADENEHMLAINSRIGFRVASPEGDWQRKLQTSA